MLAPENLRYHAMSNRIEQVLWFLTNPLLVHDMDSKEAMTQWVGRIANQV